MSEPGRVCEVSVEVAVDAILVIGRQENPEISFQLGLGAWGGECVHPQPKCLKVPGTERTNDGESR